MDVPTADIPLLELPLPAYKTAPHTGETTLDAPDRPAYPEPPAYSLPAVPSPVHTAIDLEAQVPLERTSITQDCRCRTCRPRARRRREIEREEFLEERLGRDQRVAAIIMVFLVVVLVVVPFLVFYTKAKKESEKGDTES